MLLWDNRDHSIHTLRYWWTEDGKNHYHSPLPPYRFNQFGSGLAVSPVPWRKTGRKTGSAKASRAPRRPTRKR